MYNSFDKRIWFTISFTSQGESHSFPDMDFFYYTFITFVLSKLELSRMELPKLTPGIVMENCDHSICPV